MDSFQSLTIFLVCLKYVALCAIIYAEECPEVKLFPFGSHVESPQILHIKLSEYVSAESLPGILFLLDFAHHLFLEFLGHLIISLLLCPCDNSQMLMLMFLS